LPFELSLLKTFPILSDRNSNMARPVQSIEIIVGLFQIVYYIPGSVSLSYERYFVESMTSFP
jgi:hypothetical protein